MDEKIANDDRSDLVPAGGDRYQERRTVFGSMAIDFKVSESDTSGGLFIVENTDNSRGGPPRHFHHEQEEWFYVVESEYVVEIGDERHRLGPGDSVLAPRRSTARLGSRRRGDGEADRRLPTRGQNGGVLRRAREGGRRSAAREASQTVSFARYGGYRTTFGGRMTYEKDPFALRAWMHTQFGGIRMIDMLVGDPLPRIC